MCGAGLRSAAHYTYHTEPYANAQERERVTGVWHTSALGGKFIHLALRYLILKINLFYMLWTTILIIIRSKLQNNRPPHSYVVQLLP